MFLHTLLLFLVCCSGLWAMPQQVILLRHGEKPAQGDSLSPAGFSRAEALINYFASPPFQMQTPVALFAQRSNKSHMSTRPVQTIGPLANSLELPLYTSYSSQKYKKMVSDISKNYASGLVIICWSHDDLQDIAVKFGVKNAPVWPSEAYDWVWVINFDAKGGASMQEYHQYAIS